MFTATGRGGRLLCTARVAASFGSWSLAKVEGGYIVVATLATRDRYWLEHGGRFTVVLPWGQSVLRWKNVAAAVADDEITIDCPGGPEE